jgi:hypothetical protein
MMSIFAVAVAEWFAANKPDVVILDVGNLGGIHPSCRCGR